MTGKTIVLGIGGGIASSKITDLASKLTQRGADVHAVLTRSATKFIAPLTFQTLTHNPALTSLWVEENNAGTGKSAGMPHIALADNADLILIAPATADLIARLANGFGDDLLTTLVLATRAPVAISPAMNPTMLAHPATQRNLQTLRDFGYHIIEPNSGRMACEHIGSGRLPETPEMIGEIEKILFPNLDLVGKTVVITAGPTRENLDPVRYLTNRSSGKMGYALAANAAQRGAKVTLISGPTNLPIPQKMKRIEVETALQMLDATQNAFRDADILIAAAAPADFRAAEVAPQKMKRAGQTTTEIQLIANPDIVASCAQNKRAAQIVVGFAAETENLIAEARKKLSDKNLDAIVANDVTQEGAGFDVETNRVTWISTKNESEWPLLTKNEVAARIWDEILKI
ncbi:Phosphopantothenate-cysteine ligase /Phosphopantothenoylcysteine decarboxylase [Abditibacterium utsteinense]|uniref:Coenzyme A biosynthesis bifunctional protein CoaBC n=1 Tax=Abditibacterium utsteinense TaxID=1960156 RepID=A0A2S8SRH3_9BACT|nr:bifunctional phosphopantothenoylcysteine decarboxylase/phosphopantothenate--cysteine ligase CoaBC [Abditibacterium utsteinense]PQV63349.1 Phosphopantothenate-cysteine ligase /Phosphopantothenoylcysteine decarboxylase [Abditibacterium utsteinense]